MISETKYKTIHGERMQISTLKQILQIPKALTQVKIGHTSENLLNEVCQTIYYFYRPT